MLAADQIDSTEVTTVEPLSAADRCDICGAQAYVRVELATGELLFCAHHGNEKKAQLEPVTKVWHDESAKLATN